MHVGPDKDTSVCGKYLSIRYSQARHVKSFPVMFGRVPAPRDQARVACRANNSQHFLRWQALISRLDLQGQTFTARGSSFSH